MLLNAAKCQGYSFYASELLRENQQAGTHTQFRVKPEFQAGKPKQHLLDWKD